MTFDTGNPIGSTDSRDRLDNAENMDYLENSTTELTHPDRLGTVRKTRHGMEAEHDAQISAHESEHDAQMQAFESDFDGRLAGMAFTRVGSFTTGATLTDMRQVLVWEASQGGDGHDYGWAGAFPKVVAAGATPATSGGIGAGAWVDRTDVVLRSELAGSAGTLVIGRGARTLSDRLDASQHVKDYSTLADALAAGSGRLVFEAGNYAVSDDTVISRHCVIHKGATITVAAGKKLTFTGHVEAGHYKIFSHSVNLLDNYTASAPVVIKGCVVKAAWFSDYVSTASDILTIPDQTNNLTVAARAAFGDWIADGANFRSSMPSGVLKFCGGYWRCDGEFAPSKQYSVDGKFYKLTGGTIKGESAGASYLVRTALSSTDVVFKVGRYTGDLTTISGLKVFAYNPSGSTSTERFDSSSKCLAYFQGDALALSNFWVAGAKVSDRVDARGCYRNGVGIQFESCIDTRISEVFVEYCVTGIAVSSSQITASGVTLFNTLRTSIGIGNFLTEWPDVQAGYSSIQMDKVLANNLANNAITTLEIGALSNIQISGLFDGYNTENSTQTGYEMVRVSPGTRLRGSMSGEFRNWNSKLFDVKSQACLGDEGNSFRLHNFSLKHLFGIGAVVSLASDALCVATVSNGSILDCYGVLFEGNSQTITFSDLSLSNFGGHIDGSLRRSLFAIGGGTLNMERVYRNSLDTEALTQYGYAEHGSVVKIDCNIANATRSVNGGGTVTMPQYVTFS